MKASEHFGPTFQATVVSGSRLDFTDVARDLVSNYVTKECSNLLQTISPYCFSPTLPVLIGGTYRCHNYVLIATNVEVTDAKILWHKTIHWPQKMNTLSNYFSFKSEKIITFSRCLLKWSNTDNKTATFSELKIVLKRLSDAWTRSARHSHSTQSQMVGLFLGLHKEGNELIKLDVTHL